MIELGTTRNESGRRLDMLPFPSVLNEPPKRKILLNIDLKICRILGLKTEIESILKFYYKIDQKSLTCPQLDRLLPYTFELTAVCICANM